MLKVKGNRITLGFVAPQEVAIMRSELSKPCAAKPTQIELVVEDGMLVAG
ncbi:MAG: carbon storage regulator [Pirellulales bacterium]